MSIYADMPNKDIAEKIVNLWGLINENAQMQYQSRDTPLTLQMLEKQEKILLSRVANLGLELAKKIIAESESQKCPECDGTGISMLSPVKPNSYIKCPKCGGTGVTHD